MRNAPTSRMRRRLLGASLALALPLGIAPALGTTPAGGSPERAAAGDLVAPAPGVVERHVSSDMVVDWLEAPPADATAWLAEPEAPAHLGADDHDHQEQDHGVTHAEAASASAPTETAAPGEGFAVFSATPRLVPGGYTIRLTGPDGRIEQYRDELEAAARAASAASGIPVRVAPGRGGAATPARGEITAVIGAGPCGGAALGCGGPTLTSTEVVSGRVWIAPAGLDRPQAERLNLAAHELGHALGLRHHTAGWSDGVQVMYPQVVGVTTYRAGDGRGLKYLAGGFDRAAGSITGSGYAAGNVLLSGTVSSGSRVRVAVGSTSRDVTASGGRFQAEVPAGPGTHRVCATSLDAAAGHRRQLGCADVTAPGAPFGRLEAVGGSFESIHVGGWAIDPQTADPIQVEVRRNGQLVSAAPASTSRPDVASAHPRYGDEHGFSVQVPAVAGANQICVRAKGVGGGGSTELGCATVTHAVDPIGAFEAIRPVELGVVVSGWALDPNTPSPVDVRVTVDGSVPATPGSFRAGEDRPDVARAHPAHGPSHGFAQRLVLTPGEHEVCLTVVNVGLGADRDLGCRSVRVGGAADLVGGAVRGVPVVEGVVGSGGPLAGVDAVVTGAVGALLPRR